MFDKGTILIRGATRGAGVAGGIPGAVWDPRVGCLRAPACSYAEIRRHLEQASATLDDQVDLAPPVAPRTVPALRPYQQTAVHAWELAGRRGLVVLPTGSGKTRVALAAIAGSGLAALCLVPTRVLLEQWRAALSQAGLGPVGCYGDGERSLARITVATFESAYRHMGALGNRFALLIADEVHHFGTGMRDEALEMCTAPARLGLTATPPDGAGAVERLRRLVGGVVYRLALGDLTGSFLAPFDLVTLEIELSAAERAAYAAEVARFRPVIRSFFGANPLASWTDLVRAASATPEGREALAAWRRARRLLGYPQAKAHAVAMLLDAHRGQRLLIFTADNVTAYAVAREHLVMPLTCDIGRKERAAALARFCAGGLAALVSARVLNEGLDVPDADVAIVVGGSQGEREHVQRIGRLLRPVAGKKAIVYELVCRDTGEVAVARRRRLGLASRSTAAVQRP